MSWLSEFKKEAKQVLRGLEHSLSDGLIEDPYMGCSVKVSSPPHSSSILLSCGEFLEPTSLPREHLQAAVAILREEFSKHPVGVLRSSVGLVCLYDRMMIGDAGLSGTCDLSERTLYAACIINEEGWEDWLRRTFHHEACHLILHYNRCHWAVEAWHQVNPPGFQYKNEGVTWRDDGRSLLTIDPQLNEMGLLNQYSSISAEEDFCCICHEIFAGTSGIWDILEKHPRLLAKVKLAMTFFRHLHEDYSEARFRSYDSHQRA